MSNLRPTEFTDLQGSVWDATVTVAAAKRVDSVDYSALTNVKFSLLRPTEAMQGLFAEIMSNTGFMFALLFDIMFQQLFRVLSTDPITHRADAELEFTQRMGGEQIKSAREALWRAFEDFFPDQRIVLQRLWQSYKNGQQKIQENLDALEPEAAKLLNKQLDLEMRSLRERLLEELQRGLTSAESPKLPE